MQALAMWRTQVHVSLFLIAVVFQLKTSLSADASQRATYKKIYTDITHFTSCFRRFNGTHQVGCASDSIGNTGVLHYVSNSSGLRWLLYNGNQAPYVAIIPSAFFTNDTVRSLVKSGKINGILVIFTNASDPTQYPDNFSPDSSCPGMDYGLYNGSQQYGCDNTEWNPYGNSMMFEDFSFPISIILDQAEANKVIQCYQDFNAPDSLGNERPYPLCAAEVKAFMYGAKDSATCWRRTNLAINLSPEQYCQVIGSRNVHATLGNGSARANSSVVVLAARMDAFSMFENLVPGANNHISGIVTLLATAELIGQIKKNITASGKDVWFMLLEGEAFDYIGSSRVVYDLLNNRLPMKMENIGFFLELFQLATATSSGNLYLHTDPLSSFKYNNEIDRMKNAFASSNVSIKFLNATAGKPLPPSSVQQFLKYKSMPAVVVTDHIGQYLNKFFNSRLDTAYAINVSYPAGMNDSDKYNYVTPQARTLAQTATAVARAVYEYATGQTYSDSLLQLAASETKVANLLYCFLINPKCDLFYTVVEPGSSTSILDQATLPYPSYVSVTATSLNPLVYITNQLLLFYTGDVIANTTTADDCSKVPASTWINGPAVNATTGERPGVCITGNTFYTDASSPAFEIPGYDFTSKQYPTWTESVWPSNDAFHVRIFLVPSTTQKVLTLCCGILVLLTFGFLSYFIRKRALILFVKSGGL